MHVLYHDTEMNATHTYTLQNFFEHALIGL